MRDDKEVRLEDKMNVFQKQSYLIEKLEVFIVENEKKFGEGEIQYLIWMKVRFVMEQEDLKRELNIEEPVR